MNIETLSQRLRGLAVLKVEKKRLADAAKEVNTEIDEQEREITGAMIDLAEVAGLSCVDDFSVNVDGRRYSVTTKPFYSLVAMRHDEAFDALRELGLGDLIVPRVDDRSLTKALVEIRENAGGELPEEYESIPMRSFDKLTISDRKVG